MIPQLLVAQIISILVTILVAVAGTLICIAIVRLFTTLRVEKREEQIGLDISQHNETAYPSFNGIGLGGVHMIKIEAYIVKKSLKMSKKHYHKLKSME